jgi:hypothetical protein
MGLQVENDAGGDGRKPNRAQDDACSAQSRP